MFSWPNCPFQSLLSLREGIFLCWPLFQGSERILMLDTVYEVHLCFMLRHQKCENAGSGRVATTTLTAVQVITLHV